MATETLVERSSFLEKLRIRQIQQFFVEVRSEMKKVVWPSREETIRLTAVVIALSAIISVVLFSADALFATLLGLLQGAVK